MRTVVHPIRRAVIDNPLDLAEQGQPPDCGNLLPQTRDKLWATAGGNRDHRGRALPPPPAGQHPHRRGHQIVAHRCIWRARCHERAQPVAPADTAQAGERPSRLRTGRLRYPAGDADAQRAHARRPHPAWFDRGARAVQLLLRTHPGGFGDHAGPPAAGAGVAASARCRGGIVQLTTKKLQPAAGGGDVVEHRLLLARTAGADPGETFGVVGPGCPGGLPATADPPDRTVDVEHLQHGLEPPMPDVHACQQRLGGHRGCRPRECAQHPLDHALRGEGGVREIRPDVAVLLGR